MQQLTGNFGVWTTKISVMFLKFHEVDMACGAHLGLVRENMHQCLLHNEEIGGFFISFV